MGLHGGPPKGLIIELERAFSIPTFLETGTFTGATASWASGYFRQVVTVEGSAELHAAAAQRHRHLTNVRFVQGDSRAVLADVAAGLELPVLAWLDSHWSGGPTYGEHDECPVLFEIETLRALSTEPFLFIDDARMFVAPPPHPHKSEQWPSLTQVVEALTRGDNPLEVLLLDDTLIGVPRRARELVWRHAQDAATRAWEQHQAETSASPAVRGARKIKEGVRLLVDAYARRTNR